MSDALGPAQGGVPDAIRSGRVVRGHPARWGPSDPVLGPACCRPADGVGLFAKSRAEVMAPRVDMQVACNFDYRF